MKALSLFLLLFACVFAGAQTITVTQPTSSTAWQTGFAQTITWTSTGVSNVDITFTDDGGITWQTIATNVPSPGSYVWAVNSNPTTYCVIRIVNSGGSGVGISQPFIVGPVIKVIPITDKQICAGGDHANLNANAQYIAGDGPASPPPPPALTYTWSPSTGLSDTTVFSVEANPASTTTYIVTITDGGSLVAYDTVVVTVNPAFSVSIVNTGNGTLPDTLVANVTGGCAPYQYSWNFGGNGSSTVAYNTSNYMVTVTNNCGCSATASIATGGTAPTANAGPSVTVCTGGQGTIGGNPTASGGIPPYTYSWSPSAQLSCATCPNPVVSPSTNGSFRVIVEDATGAKDTDEVFVFVFVGYINNNSDGIMPDTLYAASNVMVGACTPLSYQWSTGATAGSIIVTVPGLYTVTVSDNCGCTSSYTENVGALGVNILSHHGVTCYGLNDGYISVAGTGGGQPHQYTIDGGATFQPSGVFANLPPGPFTIWVHDTFGDSVSVVGIVTSPSAPLTVQETHTNVNCFGDTTGSIDITAQGGTPIMQGGNPGYMYTWTGWLHDEDRTGLAAGIYYVTVRDDNNCAAYDTITITQPANSLSVSVNSTNVSCFGGVNGSICVTATGGAPPLTVNWSVGGVGPCINLLLAGTYAYTVTDANTCTVSGSVNLTQPTALTATLTATNATCGQTNGSICPAVSGGTAPYWYAWSNGATDSCQLNLPAGIYTVTITDANGCNIGGTDTVESGCGVSITVLSPNGGETFTAGQNIPISWSTTGNIPKVKIEVSTTVGWMLVDDSTANDGSFVWPSVPGMPTLQCYVKISDPYSSTADSSDANFTIATGALMLNTPTVVNPMCSWSTNGSINASGAGGTLPYQYSINNGITWQQSPYFGNLGAGSYVVQVKDAVNTIVSSPTILVTAPPLLQMAYTVTNDGFFPDTISVTVTGGTPPYSNLGSNGPGWPTFPIIMGPGMHRFKVNDAAGCGAYDSIDVQPNGPPSVIVTYPNGGETLVVGQNVNIAWGSTGSIPKVKIELYSSIALNWITLVDSVANTGSYVYGIPSVPNMQGKIRVSDPYNASVNDESDALFNIVQAGSFTVLPNTTDVTCFGLATGSIHLAVSGGGTAPFQYSIDGGITFQAAPLFTALAAGTYNAVVKDATNAAVSTQVTLTEPAGINVVPNTTPTACGSLSGSICISISGGAGGYVQLWSNSDTSVCTVNLASGNYSVTVTDAAGCVATANALVTGPTNLQVVIMPYSSMPDSVIAWVLGGTLPFDTIWNNGVTGSGPVAVDTFPFAVTIIDGSGCVAVHSLSVDCVNDVCVWPGDANYDGVADNTDLLPIGLAYSAAGPGRSNPDNKWYGHPAGVWADTLNTGSNYVHIDCNGSGAVNHDDTLAILRNYNLSHPRSGMDEIRGGVPQLRIEMVPDTLADGETVVAHLFLGDSLNTATNVYGLAFTFNFDPLVVDSTEVSIQFNNNSWLCNNATDHIDIDKKFYSTGQIHSALTRIDHTMRSGQGEIGNVSMKITTGNINGKNLAYYAMQCYISDLVMIDNQGNYLAVDPSVDSATIEYELTGISEISLNSGVSIYPNPATDVLNITSKQNSIQQFTITNLLGEVIVNSKQVTGNTVTVNTAELAQGVYIIRVQSGAHEFTARFMKD